MERPEVKYANSGDLSIAYCQYGDGVDVVVVPGSVTHLDLIWDLPISKSFDEVHLGARIGVTRRTPADTEETSG